MEKGVAGKSSGAVAGEPSRRRRRTGKKFLLFLKKIRSFSSTHFPLLISNNYKSKKTLNSPRSMSLKKEILPFLYVDCWADLIHA
jgi:hypothetical protein